MSDRKITDEGVTGLPIHDGRAELLEEIMAIPTENQNRHSATDELAARRRTRWLPVAGAAAAVAAIAAAVTVPSLLADDEKRVQELPAAAAPGNGDIAVLDDPAWTLTYASIDPKHGGELSYEAADQGIDATPDNDWGVTLDIHWRPADQYQGYYADREDIGAGEAVELLGRPGTMWHYSKDDHTVIREVVGDFTLEVRGSGMLEEDYLALMEQLTPIAPADLDAHLPKSFVTDAERDAVIAEMLEPIPLPDGFDAAAIRSTEIDRYQLGVDVAGPVACAWIAQYVDGDAAAQQEAADAMATSRDWPVLGEMAESGDWPSFVWDTADEMAAGKAPAKVSELAAGICDGLGTPGQ